MSMRGNLGSASYTTLIANSIAVPSDHAALRLCKCENYFIRLMMIYLVIIPEPVYRRYARLLPLST